jgi:hypothetical protein
MQVHLTFERETKHTVRFAEDEADQPETHPGAPVIETLYLQKFAWAQLGKPERLAVSVEALTPKGAP